jgi:plastocyanin
MIMRTRVTSSRFWRLLACLGLGVALLWLWHGPTVQAGSLPAQQSPVVHVTILNFQFAPTTLKITGGTTVVWTNKDSVAHTVTGTNAPWGSGNLNLGQTYAHTFTKAGTYQYHCAIHPSMSASVLVS